MPILLRIFLLHLLLLRCRASCTQGVAALRLPRAGLLPGRMLCGIRSERAGSSEWAQLPWVRARSPSPPLDAAVAAEGELAGGDA